MTVYRAGLARGKSRLFSAEMDEHLRTCYAHRVDPAVLAYAMRVRFYRKGVNERTVRARLADLGILRRDAWRLP